MKLAQWLVRIRIYRQTDGRTTDRWAITNVLPVLPSCLSPLHVTLLSNMADGEYFKVSKQKKKKKKKKITIGVNIMSLLQNSKLPERFEGDKMLRNVCLNMLWFIMFSIFFDCKFCFLFSDELKACIIRHNFWVFLVNVF